MSRATRPTPSSRGSCVPGSAGRCWAASGSCAGGWGCRAAGCSSTTASRLPSTTGVPRPCGASWTRKPGTRTTTRAQPAPAPRYRGHGAWGLGPSVPCILVTGVRASLGAPLAPTPGRIRDGSGGRLMRFDGTGC